MKPNVIVNAKMSKPRHTVYLLCQGQGQKNLSSRVYRR